MRSARFEHLLAGTAVALALALTPYAGTARAASDAEISAAVPMPESADLPPPSVKDVVPAEAAPQPAKLAQPQTAEQPANKPEQAAAKPEQAATMPEQAAAPAPTPAPSAAAKPAAETTASVPASDSAKDTATISADAAMVDKLRDNLTSGKFDRLLGSKKERASVEAFYSNRDFAPLWVVDGAISERGKAAAAYLAGVDADGLEPSEYPVPQIKAGMEADALAEAEVKFTDAIITYAHHAMDGRVHYTRVSGDIIYDLAKVDPENVLGQLAKAQDVAATLNGFEPQQPQYKALKAELAKLRHGSGDITKPVIPSGAVLKYTASKKGKAATEAAMQDPRVPALRQWFSLEAEAGDTTYDKTLSDTVARFQKDHHLRANGHLTQATLDAINGPKRDKTEDIIVANMERWRWMPRDLGTSYVMVNIPDYSLRVVHDGKLVWKTKVVVGQPGKPTPLLSAEMKYITVNPTWNVPPSIIQNEYLPALQQDPQAMDRIGLKVEQNKDGTIRIYQPPGDRNALGRIRFNFPNKFLVYQHDTPDKYLFARDKRAYSHGCMRVENPLKYGEVILGLVLPKEHYTAERLQKMFGGSEININFPTSIPDHLTYQTAFVDENGHLQIRDDVYGRDAKLISILKGSERKVADIAIDRPHGSSTAPVKMPPGSFGGATATNNTNPFGEGGFFSRLFGGAPEPAPATPKAKRANSHDRRASR